MKRISIFAFAVLLCAQSFAQVGIGTTSPNTTLDVRGSLAANTRSFSTTTETVQLTDFALLFTGNSACTLTLPDATTCIGRMVHVKNTKTATVPTLTITPIATQSIDGQAIWLLDDPNESVNVVSDGTSWKIMGTTLPAGSGTAWTQSGNTVTAEKKLGTTDNYDLPFITGNTERMRITNTGSVGIGTSTFNTTYPERLLVNAGASGNTNFQNVIVGKGNTNSYAQLNIQNNSGGTGASSDVVATANNGSETVNYIDMGINGGGNTSTGVLGGANTAYLYATGSDFAIGNGTASKAMKFFTNDGGTYTEQMRISSDGNVAIGSNSFDNADPEKFLIDAGSTSSRNLMAGYGSINDYLQVQIANLSSGGKASTDFIAANDQSSTTANYIDIGINSSGYTNGKSNILNGANTAYLYAVGDHFFIGNGTPNKDLIFFTNTGDSGVNTANGTERMRLTSSGLQPGGNGIHSLGTSTNRWSAVFAANGTIQTSDKRLKTNIYRLKYGLREIMAMQPVSYNWISNPNGNHKIGLLAQDVKQLVPEVVAGDETKENLGMNYAELVPVLINAIKEQQQQIEELSKRIKALENK